MSNSVKLTMGTGPCEMPINRKDQMHGPRSKGHLPAAPLSHLPESRRPVGHDKPHWHYSWFFAAHRVKRERLPSMGAGICRPDLVEISHHGDGSRLRTMGLCGLEGSSRAWLTLFRFPDTPPCSRTTSRPGHGYQTSGLSTRPNTNLLQKPIALVP